jgi:peptidoglycan/xylan/chitin deacetylase (PgdA/CDA1 family)
LIATRKLYFIVKILHLLSQTELTGAEVYAQELIRYQLQMGHQVFVISDRIHVQLPIEWTALPISRSGLKARLILFFKLRKFFRDHQVEVVHCHSRGAVRHAHTARRGTPVAMVTTVHGKQHSSWSKRWVDAYGEFKILICENLFKQFTNEFNVSIRSLRLLRNPFSAAEFSFERELIPRPRWAFVGRSSGPKGERLRAFFENGFYEYLKQHPEIDFDIIASNPENWGEDFLKQLRSLGSRVQILGEVKNLKSHLKNYQTVLAAGRVAMECLLTGIQVIAFGEAESLGLINRKTLRSALASNFGDIAENESSPVNTVFLLKSFEKSWKEPLNSTEREFLRGEIQKQFSSEKIQPLIVETYRAAVFKRRVPRWIPILMYHKIPQKIIQSQHRIFVTRERFGQHLKYFKKHGFNTLTFQDLQAYWTGERSLSQFPKKPLVLTFDDGYRDNLTEALPLLREHSMKAVIFLLSDHRLIENTWDSEQGEAPATLMDLAEKKQIAQSGVFEIGSHGIDHLRLPSADDGEVLHQMQESKASLEKDLGVAVTSFAYPFGDIDPRLPVLAREAGYQFAVNTDRGGLDLSENPWSLFRVNIFPEDGSFQLWKKTSSWYRKYFYRKHGQ